MTAPLAPAVAANGELHERNGFEERDPFNPNRSTPKNAEEGDSKKKTLIIAFAVLWALSICMTNTSEPFAQGARGQGSCGF